MLADGYYEWLKEGKAKQPFLYEVDGGKPFAFAGLWEWWRGPEGKDEPVESCTIITTDANELASEVHDRMPVILDADDYDAWLDPSNDDRDAMQAMVVPFPRTACGAARQSLRQECPQQGAGVHQSARLRTACASWPAVAANLLAGGLAAWITWALTSEQAAAIHDELPARQSDTWPLRNWIDECAFPREDELRRLIEQADDALDRLVVKLHYLSGPATASGRSDNAPTLAASRARH